MSLVLAMGIVVAVTAAAVGLMLVVRRSAPPGGRFTDHDRAAGVFGVVGTGFAVLLAFVIFIAFESYNGAKEQAAREAIAVRQMFRVTTIFAASDTERLRGELVCYARSVVRDEWPRMRDGGESRLVEDWLERLEQSARVIGLRGDRQAVAYAQWFDQSAQRQEGRRGRLAEAAPFVPGFVWAVLILAGALVVSYVLFFADPAEPALVQSVMMVAIAATVVSGLLVVRFLDRPYTDVSGSIRPVAMSRTLSAMEELTQRAGAAARIPCDEGGATRAAR